MRRRASLLGLAVLLWGCSGTQPWRPVTDWVQVWRLVERADGLAKEGDPAGARAVYVQVVQDYPQSPWTPQALYRMARLEVTPESPVHNYRQAYAHFDRLVKDFPESAYAAEARAWRDALGRLLHREQEASRIHQDMERLKKLELEQEREAARARSDLEQLKKTDTELETKRP